MRRRTPILFPYKELTSITDNPCQYHYSYKNTLDHTFLWEITGKYAMKIVVKHSKT
jgi:hypothetical protein